MAGRVTYFVIGGLLALALLYWASQKWGKKEQDETTDKDDKKDPKQDAQDPKQEKEDKGKGNPIQTLLDPKNQQAKLREKYDDMTHLKTFLDNAQKLATRNRPESYKGMDLELMQKLEALSKKAGKKLYITSGFRDAAHNKKVGGVSNSSHLIKKAVDFDTTNPEDSVKMAKAAFDVGFRRIGVAGGFVHVDTDHRRHPAVWTYKSLPYTKDQIKTMINMK